ncbi:hypothetical protein RvY_14838-2 [Ramazzottius varieornatus]|uniref:G-protein coupled receptors family 1 profile domain-containing protein n=1 Tax=Ramazzottius varieornatus TaxID=947166 RepID=A0A1D1VU77_RAMVA|nr:hypothetical protein RvY_14838-2 [Ramazzottius varieornatus]
MVRDDAMNVDVSDFSPPRKQKFNDSFDVDLLKMTTSTFTESPSSQHDPSLSNNAFRPCEALHQNWTSPIEEIATFITTYNPHYFTNRPWIISGLFLLAVIGLVANCAVICYIACLKRAGHMSALNLLVLQLAVADTLVCLFCLLADAIWNITMKWNGSTELCRFVKFMQMFSLYASTMILTGMTVERCINVTYPLSLSRADAALSRSRIISVAAWLLAALCSIPQAIIFHVERAPTCTDFHQCVTHGAYSSRLQEVAYTMSTLCIMFVIPLIIFAACFIIFLKTSQESRIALGKSPSKIVLGRNATERSRRRSTLAVTLMAPHNLAILLHSKLFQLHRTVSAVSSTERDGLHEPDTALDSPSALNIELQHVNLPADYGRRLYRRTRRFSIWMTFGIALAYIVCWAPYYISMLGYLFDCEISNGWMTIILSFGMTSTLLNPVIYGIFKFMSIRRERVDIIPSLVMQLKELNENGPVSGTEVHRSSATLPSRTKL